MTDQMDAELTLRFANTSLDPYLRFFAPQLSPFTTAVAGGTIRVVGELADVDHLVVDALRRAARSEAVRLPGEQPQPGNAARAAAPPTGGGCAEGPDASCSTSISTSSTSAASGCSARAPSCRSSGNVNLHDSTIAVQASGDANLGILQGFYPRHPQLGRRHAQGADRRVRSRSRSSPAAPRSPTAASASSRCRIRSRRSTARSRSTPVASASTTCARGSPAAT